MCLDGEGFIGWNHKAGEVSQKEKKEDWWCKESLCSSLIDQPFSGCRDRLVRFSLRHGVPRVVGSWLQQVGSVCCFVQSVGWWFLWEWFVCDFVVTVFTRFSVNQLGQLSSSYLIEWGITFCPHLKKLQCRHYLLLSPKPSYIPQWS